MLNGVKDKQNNELGGEIVVTEAMIEAGLNRLIDLQGVVDSRFLVEQVLQAALPLKCQT